MTLNMYQCTVSHLAPLFLPPPLPLTGGLHRLSVAEAGEAAGLAGRSHGGALAHQTLQLRVTLVLSPGSMVAEKLSIRKKAGSDFGRKCQNLSI